MDGKLRAGEKVGEFQLIRLLGYGGMGEVWLAQDERAQRPVALKFIKLSLLNEDPGLRSRFLDEIKILGRLEHERIVTLYSVLEADGRLAMALRFIDGHSLGDEIKQSGGLSLDRILSFASDVLPALAFAHSRGVIHRDIKADNIMVDREGRSFLSDFGIAATEFTERHTQHGSAIGTLSYMSPEQIRDSRSLTVQNGGFLSDIYSAGVLLFEMATGQLPFPGTTLSVANDHLMKPPPRPSDLKLGLNPNIERVILRCMKKDPAARPQGALALLQELQAAASAGLSSRSGTVYIPSDTTEIKREAAGFAPQAPAPVVVTPPVLRKAPLAKYIWPVLGLLCIAGGITYVVQDEKDGGGGGTDRGKKEERKKKDDQNGTGDTGSAITKPLPQPPGVRTGSPQAEVAYTEGQNLLASGDACAAKQKFELAANTSLGVAKYQQALIQSAPACQNQNRANLLADDARGADTRGNPCEASKLIGQAVQLNPARREFQLMLAQYDGKCKTISSSQIRAEELRQEAEANFQSGNYCAAQAKIEEAMAVYPPAAGKLSGRRKTFKDACVN